MQLSANAADERAASASFPAAMAATAKNVCSEEMKKKYVHIHTYWWVQQRRTCEEGYTAKSKSKGK